MPTSVLTPRALEVLQTWAAAPDDDDDYDIMVEGVVVYFGREAISYRTFQSLIRCTAISKLYDDGPYYGLNDTGRAIARRPELADEVFAAIMSGRGAFSIVEDRLVSI